MRERERSGGKNKKLNLLLLLSFFFLFFCFFSSQDGVHYHFVEKEDILKDIDDGKFLEHARVSSNVYGTSYAAVKRVSVTLESREA